MNIDLLIDELAILASKFRGSSAAERPPIVSEYNVTLRKLLASGWTDGLDPDCELPDELMDSGYLISRDHRPDQPSTLLRATLRDYDALLVSVRSIGQKAYAAIPRQVYCRRFEGPQSYESGNLSFIGGSSAWGNKQLADDETAVVFLRYSGGVYRQKPWQGHFTQQVINGDLCAIANFHLLDTRAVPWKPNYLREAAFFPEAGVQSKVALPYDMFERHLLDEIAMLA